jgi:flagellar protein FliO/FliZ
VGTLAPVFSQTTQQSSTQSPGTQTGGSSLRVSVNAPGAVQTTQQNSATDQTFQGAGTGSADQQTQPNQPLSIPSITDESLLLFSDTGNDDDSGSQGVQVIGVIDLLRMVFVLAGVLASIYGLFWLIKRSKTGTTGASDSVIQVRDQVILGGSKAIYLVQIGDRMFMVGGTENSLNLLTELDDKETLQEIQVTLGQKTQKPVQNFSSLLGDLLGTQPGGTKKTGKGSSFEFLHAQKERLKKW